MISGNVFKFCNGDISLIENYNQAIKDRLHTWDCHHRLEIQEDKILSREELKELNLYYNRPPHELIFLTVSEHMRLHKNNPTEEYKQKLHNPRRSSPGRGKGKIVSQETRKKLSIVKTGFKHSEETKQLLSKLGKNRKQSPETRRKISESNKGKHFITGYKHSEETKRRMSQLKYENKSTAGFHWYNNGSINIYLKDGCPLGFKPGRIKRSKK